MSKGYTLITTDSELSTFCSGLGDESYIAVDTEFDRRTTYYPTLSLVQIATSSSVAIIDAMRVDISSSLKIIFSNPEIIKVFHAGRQDLEILEYILPNPTQNIFDTQIAAVLIGLGDNLSFSNIVKHFLDIDIDKTQQNKSWINRPLSNKQLEYAYQDVSCLFKVFPKINKKLIEQERLPWLQDIQKRLLSHNKFNFLDYWQKVKLTSSNTKTWFRLRRIWLWREEVARLNNLHRSLIFSDHTLILLAQYKELSGQKLQEKVHSLWKTLNNFNIWDDFLSLYQQSFADSDALNEGKFTEELEVIKNFLKHRKPSTLPFSVVNQIKAINQIIAKTAQELGIPKHYIASNDEIQTFAISPSNDHSFFRDWRRNILLDQLQYIR